LIHRAVREDEARHPSDPGAPDEESR
jgi:hypothetical protein